MNPNNQHLIDRAVVVSETTARCAHLLRVAVQKQELIKRRVAMLEYRIDFIMGVIQETKATWHVK